MIFQEFLEINAHVMGTGSFSPPVGAREPGYVKMGGLVLKEWFLN